MLFWAKVMVLLTAILCAYATHRMPTVDRLRAALPLAAKAFLARIQAFKAEETQTSGLLRRPANAKRWKTVSEYGFEVVNGNVREKRKNTPEFRSEIVADCERSGPLILLVRAIQSASTSLKASACPI